jgi:two-component system, LuxR family, response regulator TtrR
MNTAPLKLYVVDDDEAVRRSLGMLLLSRGYAVQLFDSGESFLTSNYEHHEGCLILDLRLEGMSGLELLDILRSRNSSLVIIFLSAHGDIPAALEAMQNGAYGWLEKPCSDEILLEKVQQALAHATSLEQKKIAAQNAQMLWGKLTPREKEIARLVADGKSSKVIARELTAIEPRTVETHRAHAYSKLGFSNSNELDRFLRQYNL